MLLPCVIPTANDCGEYYFNPAACGAADLAACEFMGAFLGRALLEGSAPSRLARLRHVTLGGFRMCDAFYKVLIGGEPLTLADVADVSRADFISLKYVSDHGVDGVDLGLFVHEVFPPGATVPCAILPLRPGGAAIPVTSANYGEFVLLKGQSLLVASVARLLDAACMGFYSIVPPSVLRASGVTPKQLRELLCGAGEGFDVQELRAHTHYGAPYSTAHPVVSWLWEVLAEAGAALQSSFVLEFCGTGAPVPPADGFAALALRLDEHRYPLTIVASRLRADGAAPGAPPRLPSSHTCGCSLARRAAAV